LKEKLRGGKKKGGEGEFLSSMDMLGGGSSKRLAKNLQRLLYSLERASEQESEIASFWAPSTSLPSPILQRLSHSPTIQNKTKKHNRLWLYMDFIPRSSTFILFSIQGSPTKLCSQPHQVLVISQIPSSTP
jgi:hypothetical protein